MVFQEVGNLSRVETAKTTSNGLDRVVVGSEDSDVGGVRSRVCKTGGIKSTAEGSEAGCRKSVWSALG